MMCLGAGGLVGLELNGSVSKLPFPLVSTFQCAALILNAIHTVRALDEKTHDSSKPCELAMFLQT